MDIEEIAETDPSALVRRHIEPGEELTAEAAAQIAIDARIDEDATGQVGEMLLKLHEVALAEDATLIEVNPMIVTTERAGRCAGLQGHDRQQRPVQARGAGPAARSLGRGPTGADGRREGAHLREARRRDRHPRKRRRAVHVDARRRRPGGWAAGELPRRRGRLEGRDDRRRLGGDHLRREREGDPVQHLRRHHPLRRDRQGDHRGVGEDRDRRAAGRSARRHQLRAGPRAARRGRAAATLHVEKTMLGAAERVVELAQASEASSSTARRSSWSAA